MHGEISGVKEPFPTEDIINNTDAALHDLTAKLVNDRAWLER